MPIDFDSLVARPDTRPRMYQSHWSGRSGVAYSDDLKRIVDLPRRALELDGTERAEAIIDAMTERFGRGQVKCKCAQLEPERYEIEGCLDRLRLIQALALREMAIYGGLFGPIGTGHGKTALDVLAPLAMQVHKLSNFALLIPPKLVTQLILDYEYIGQHFHMPQLVVHGTSYENTCAKMGPTVSLRRGAPTLHVVPYSRLSRPEATDWLSQRLQPECFIADEAHRLRDITGAAASRVDRHMRDFPNTRFCGWSGSFTSRSLTDVDHLAAWALRGGSPLPVDKENSKDWDRAVGANGDPDYAGALLELCDEGEQVRHGFRRRVIETGGVVSTSTPSVNVELRITERVPPPLPYEVEQALAGVRGELPGTPGPVRPDGEVLLDALAVSRTAQQLACGFYYKWIYPRCEFPRDTDLVTEWKEARKEYHCEVRQKLKKLEDHLDSPKLVQNAAERFWGIRPQLKGMPVWKSECIKRWYAVKEQVYAETIPVFMDDFYAQWVAQQALAEPQIIWYDKSAFGEWIARLSGLPMYGAGKQSRIDLLGDPARGIRGEDGSRSVILSIKTFNTGTNGLQRVFWKAGFPNPLSSPDGWEQSIARIHRPGQPQPVVENWFTRHTEECARNVDSALSAATYIEQGWGAPQKINLLIDLKE